LLAQRLYGLALGYENLSDHDESRHERLLAVLVGEGGVLAGKSTLNRLELGAPSQGRCNKIAADLAKVEPLFVALFLQAHDKSPREIVLDLDATDDPLHGSQEGRFFHGYYRFYCYLPLYIFCGEYLLCAKLYRCGNVLNPSRTDATHASEDVMAWLPFSEGGVKRLQ
jgi:hypothetical protein